MYFRVSTSCLGDDTHENGSPEEIEDLLLVARTLRLLEQRATRFLRQLELRLSAVTMLSHFRHDFLDIV